VNGARHRIVGQIARQFLGLRRFLTLEAFRHGAGSSRRSWRPYPGR
jgi:hypothetical protein